MGATDPRRPESPMGRAIAVRACGLPVAAVPSGNAGATLDLTRSETTETAAVIREAAKSALERGETHYTARPGILPLRQAIAELSTADGFPATSEGTVVTNGGSEALFIILQALLAAGDRVLLFEPIAPDVADIVRFIGADPVALREIDDATFEGCKLLLVTAPSPINGVDLRDDALAPMIENAREHDVIVVLDRSSAQARYLPGAPFGQPDLAAGIVTIGSFSSGYGLAGWRVGYLTAPEALIERLAGLKEAMSISTTTLSQYAALAAIEHSGELLAEERRRFIRRRDAVIGILVAADVPVLEPDVYPALLIDIRGCGLDDARFAERLAAEVDVAVEPASRYGDSLAGHVRIDLGASESNLMQGVTRLALFASSLVEAR